MIAAPEAAREAADSLFELFLARAAAPSCACASSMSATKVASQEPQGSKAAGVTAVTLSTGAIACGVCCVLPFALPAAVLASTGPVLAWLVGIHKWIIVLAILAVVSAWGMGRMAIPAHAKTAGGFDAGHDDAVNRAADARRAVAVDREADHPDVAGMSERRHPLP